MMLKEKDFIKNTASRVAMEEGWQTNHKTRGENVLGKLIEFERGKIKEALVKRRLPERHFQALFPMKRLGGLPHRVLLC